MFCNFLPPYLLIFLLINRFEIRFFSLKKCPPLYGNVWILLYYIWHQSYVNFCKFEKTIMCGFRDVHTKNVSQYEGKYNLSFLNPPKHLNGTQYFFHKLVTNVCELTTCIFFLLRKSVFSDKKKCIRVRYSDILSLSPKTFLNKIQQNL